MDCYLRFFNTIMCLSEVTIFVNGNKMESLQQNCFTKYYKAMEGDYLIEIKHNDTMIASEQFSLTNDTAYTICVSGIGDTIRLCKVTDLTSSKTNSTNLQFVNLSLDEHYSIYINNKKVVNSLHYNKTTNNFSAIPKNYRLRIKSFSTNKTKVKINKLNLLPKTSYTLYITGIDTKYNGLHVLLAPIPSPF